MLTVSPDSVAAESFKFKGKLRSELTERMLIPRNSPLQTEYGLSDNVRGKDKKDMGQTSC